MSKKYLITGGAGFIGSHTTDILIKNGADHVILLDNMIRGNPRNIESALQSGKVTLIEGDIRNESLLNELMSEVDFCFHMAALRITRCAENPIEAFEVMYRGTFNVIMACVKYKIKRLVAASSASIYGQADIFPTDELHHPYNNTTLYGSAKMANELMYRSFAKMNGLQFNAMRYFNVYGPRMDTEGKYTEVLIRWYYLIKEGKSPVIFGEGDQTMDFVFVEDVARANVLAMQSPTHGEVFNVASGVETSLKELCYALIEVMEIKVEPTFVPLPDERKAVEVRRRLASTKKAKKLLNFQAQHSLRQGLKKLVQWLDSLGEEKLK
jgi:UDP-glucose 4-epimerase